MWSGFRVSEKGGCHLICAIKMIAMLGVWGGPAFAATFASHADSYSPGPGVAGDGYLSLFTHPEAATGSPDDITGENESFFPNVLNPFSPAYESDEIVVVGEGGHLVLRLPRYANVGGGLEVGVITNAGLQDSSFFLGGEVGTNYSPALGFSGGVAEVLVSEDGIDFVTLGTETFNLPSNFYKFTDGPYDSAAPANSSPADFGLPFSGTLGDFDGLGFSDTLSVLGDSGGGTWLDLSSSGLTRVGYVKFIVPDSTAGLNRLGIDAVVINNNNLGDFFPEPASLIWFGLCGVLLSRQNRA